MQDYSLEKDEEKKIVEASPKMRPLKKTIESEDDENYTMIQDEVGSVVNESARNRDKAKTAEKV